MNDIVKNEALEIARIILNQLGGNKFIVMTGAKTSYYLNDNVQPVLKCKLPNNFANNKINIFEVTYNYGLDLYAVKFSNNSKTIKLLDHVYADDLIEIFQNETGLRCRL